MASEWATSKAIKVWPESQWYLRLGRDGDIERIAAALDEAREEGAQRERWWCRELAETVTDDHGLPYTECPRCGSHIADAIASRGPMLAPEEER